MATQFQEGYLDELPDAKASGPIPPAQKTFKEGYLDQVDSPVTPNVGSMADQSGTEARFWDESVNPPKRLTPKDEEELRSFYSTQPNAEAINAWWQKKGFGGINNAVEVANALRSGKPVAGVNYGLSDNPKTQEDIGVEIADAVQDDLAESDAAFAQLPVEEQERIRQANLAASANAPVASAPPVEGFWSGVGSKAKEAFSEAGETLTAAFKRNADEAGEEQSIRSWVQQNGGTPEEAESLLEQARQNRARMIQEERASRGRYWNDQDARSDRWALTNFARDIIGEAVGDPIGTFVPQGGAATRIGRIGEAALLNTGIDAAVQLDELNKGIQDNFDPGRSLLNAVTGAAVQGGFELPGAVRDSLRTPEIPNAGRVTTPVEGEPGLPGPMGMEGEAGIPGPRFSPKPEPKVTAERVIARVNEIAEKWTNSPEIEVVQSAKELGDDVDPDALGFIGEDGKVRIIADNLQSEDDIPAVLYHEALGHHGLDQKFGEGLDNLLDRMYRSEGFKKTVDDWLEANPQYKDLYTEDANPQARIVEEYLVSLGESGQLPSPNLLAALKHYLKELGRKMKIKGLEYTDSEVMTIIGMAHNATINGRPNAASNGFRYSMEGQRDNKDGEVRLENPNWSANRKVDSRMQREDTLLRREVKKKNTEKSYEDWQRNWEFDNFIDELEAERLANGGPRYMKRPAAEASQASRSGERIRLTTQNVKRGTPPGNAAKTFLRELGIYNNLELMEMSMSEAIERASRLGVDQDWLDYFNDAKWNPETKNIDTPTPQPDMSRYLPNVKYMKRKGESEGPQTNFGRRETNAEERPYVPMGNVRSNRPGVISILEEAAPVKDRQTQDEWIAASNEVRKSAKQHQKALNPGSEPAEVLAARDSSLKLANRLTDLSVKIRDGMATDNEKWQLEVGMAQLADLLEAIDGVVSNAGRVLRSMGIEVANDAAQLAKVRALLRNKSNLSADEIAEKLADANFDPNATAQLAKDNFKPSKLDYITSYRYSAMLSGLTTPSKAIVGTLSNMLLRNASYGGALFTGKVKPGEWQTYNLGMIRSIVEASRAFKESYGLGVASNSAVNRLELQEGVKLPFSKVTEYPRRTLAGIDAFFREIIRGGEVNALAYRQALNEGLTPNTPDFEARVDYLVGLPTDEVALRLKEAKTADKKDKDLIKNLEEEYKLLKDIDKLATKQANLQQLLDNDSFVLKGLEAAGRHGPVSRFVVQNTLPFARNVDNIARMAGRNSWLGLLSPYVRGELKASPERRALMISQMNVGSLLIGLAGYMGYNGLAIPSNSDDRDMAAIDQAMGKTPGSIKIGDEWVSLAGLDAIAVPFITAATTAKAFKDGRSDELSYAIATLSAFDTMVKAFADETIIGQLEQFTGLFERGSNYSEFLASFPSSFMPSIVRQHTQWGPEALGGDRAVLDTRGDKSMTDRAIGRVLAGTPEIARQWLIDTFGLSELPQKLDIFGRPVYREGDFIAGTTGVGRGAKEETDPAIREVDRLSQIAGKAAVTKTPDEFTVDGEKVKLTPEQRMKWQYDAGQYILSDIKEAMADPVWKTLSDAEKFEEIKLITKEAKEDAKWDNFRDILETNPENQQEEEKEDPAVYEGYIEE